MEYQKISSLVDNDVVPSASNKPSIFRTRNWVEINDDIRGVYSPNKEIRFKTAILRGLVYMITVMRIYLLKEIYQLIIMQLQLLLKIILI